MSTNGKPNGATTTIAARVSEEEKVAFKAVMAAKDLTESQGLKQIVRWVNNHGRLPGDADALGDDAPTLPFAREERPSPAGPADFDQKLFDTLARVLQESILRVDLKEAVREILPEVLRPELAAAAVVASRLAGLDAPSAIGVAREALLTGKLQKEVAP